MKSGSSQLSTVWSNCSNQRISFVVDAGSGSTTLNLTVSTFGTTSHVSGHLESGNVTVIGPYAVTTVNSHIVESGMSPNAIIEGFSGKIHATNPTNGKPISPTVTFVT